MKHLYSLSDRKTDSRFYAITRNALHFSIPFLVFFLSLLTVKSEAQICCPQFKLQDAVEICPPDGACKGGSATGGVGQGMVACKLITHEYTVYPNDPGHLSWRGGRDSKRGRPEKATPRLPAVSAVTSSSVIDHQSLPGDHAEFRMASSKPASLIDLYGIQAGVQTVPGGSAVGGANLA